MTADGEWRARPKKSEPDAAGGSSVGHQDGKRRPATVAGRIGGGRDGAPGAGVAAGVRAGPRHLGPEAALRLVAADVSGHADPGRVIEDVLDHSMHLFRADRAGLWTVDEDGVSYRLAAHRNLSDALVSAMPERLGDRHLAGWRAAVDRRTLVLTDPGHRGTVPEVRRAYRELGIRTACFVPIVFLDQPLGVLTLYHHVRRPWPHDELALATTFGNEVAVAIQNARLYERVRGFAARLDAIGDLAGRLNGLQDVPAIGNAIVAEIRGLFDSDTARVYAVHHEAGVCEPIAFGGTFLGVTDPSAELLRVPIGDGVTGWVAAHDEAIRVADTRTESRRLVVGSDRTPESMLVAPMSYEGVVRGVIVVTKHGVGKFTADDLTTLSIFAGFAAQAFVNAENLARLNRQRVELERRLAGQRSLLEINERLQGPADPHQVMELIADNIRAVVRWDSITIYQLDREAGLRVPVLARDTYADLILAERAPITAGLTGWVILHNEAVLANDAHLDPRAQTVAGTPDEAESLAIVPLRARGEVIGTLNVGRFGGSSAHFSADEFELIQLFAAQASLALQTAEALVAARIQAERDALTGLRNHGAFQGDLAAAVAGGSRFAVLMLDLDGFKAFNDRHGHAAGDQLLRRVADSLAAGVRATEGDRVYRYGGDEFAAILPDVGRSDAQAIARRLASTVAGDRENRGVTISFGVAASPGDAATKDELVMAADARLYAAKAARHRGEGRGARAAVGRGRARARARSRARTRQAAGGRGDRGGDTSLDAGGAAPPQPGTEAAWAPGSALPLRRRMHGGPALDDGVQAIEGHAGHLQRRPQQALQHGDPPAAADALRVHRVGHDAAGRVGVGVAQLGEPDLLHHRRRRGAAAAAGGLEVRPIVELVTDGHLDQPTRMPQERTLDRVRVAVPDPVQPEVVPGERAVVGETGLLDDRQRSLREGPVGRTETGRRRSPGGGDGIPRPQDDVALRRLVEAGQVLVGPAVAAQLVAGRGDRADAGGERPGGVGRHEERGPHAEPAQQVQDARHAHPDAELADASIEWAEPPRDVRADGVVIEREGDGEARRLLAQR